MVHLKPVLFTLPRNMVYPALLPLLRTPRLPVVDWTDAPCRFKWTRPVSPKDEIWFLRLRHHISKAVHKWQFRLITRGKLHWRVYRSTVTDSGVCSWPWQWFALGKANLPFFV